MILVDANVLLDVIGDDPQWADWSTAQLDTWSVRGDLLINPVIYAEIAPAFDAIETLEGTVAAMDLEFEPLPREALFLAGHAHLVYRRRGGTRPGVLPDFFIGAHASVRRLPVLTRDARRYRFYFPALRLVTPDPL